AAQFIEEDRLIADATRTLPVADAAMVLAAWQGHESEATYARFPREPEYRESARTRSAAVGDRPRVNEGDVRKTGVAAEDAAYARAVLPNGLGRHDTARDAVRPVFEADQPGYGPLVVPELAEAAARTGDLALVGEVLEWMSERARTTPTDWALGIEARVRA